MSCVAGRMEWYKEPGSHSVPRSVLYILCLLLFPTVVMYPGLWSIGVQLHSLLTGSYVPGHHSVLLISSPNEQAAKDIGRYYWKGEIQDSTEIMMLVKTKTSGIQKVIDYVRSVHPYENPEVLSLSVDHGSPTCMDWIDEAVLDD